MATSVKEVKEAKVEPKAEPQLETKGPVCYNCGAALVDGKCPECGFDLTTLINYHDL